MYTVVLGSGIIYLVIIEERVQHMIKFSNLFNHLKRVFTKNKNDSNTALNIDNHELQVNSNFLKKKNMNDEIVSTEKTVDTILDERDNSKRIIKVNIISNGGIYGSVVPAVIEIDQEQIIEVDKGEVLLKYTGVANDGTIIANSEDVPSLAGIYTVTAFSGHKDYILTGNIKTTFIIGKACAEVQLPEEIGGLLYNGEKQNLIKPGDSSNGTFWYKLDTGEWKKEVPQAKDAGNYTIYYKFIADSNHEYSCSVQSLVVAIMRCPVTIVAEDKYIDCGEKEPEYTFKVMTGNIYSGDILDVNYQREEGCHAGKYEIEIFQEERKNPNYEVICRSGILTISRRETTLKVLNSGNKTYDGKPTCGPIFSTNSTANPVVEYWFDGKYRNEAPVDAGTYRVKITIPENEDYTEEIKEQELIINKAPAEVQLPEGVKRLRYNGKKQSLIKPGSSSNGIFWYKLDAAEWEKEVPQGKDASNYIIYYKFIADSNHEYPCSVQSLTVTVMRRPVTIVADDKYIDCGEKEPEYTFKVMAGNIYSGDTLDVNYQREKGCHAGKYEIAIFQEEKRNPNYEVICRSGILTISRRKTTLKVLNSGNKTYDGKPVCSPIYITNSTADPVVEYLFDGKYRNEAPVDAGVYRVRITIPENEDYTEEVKEQELIINKAPAEVQFPESIKGLRYNGEKQRLIKPGKSSNGTFWYKLGAEEWKKEVPKVKNVGNYIILCKFIVDVNYEYFRSIKKMKISIAQQPITIVADNKKIFYGEEEPEYTYRVVEGMVYGEDSLEVIFNREKGSHVGIYKILMNQDKEKNINYKIKFEPGELRILRQRAILKILDSGNKIYDGNKADGQMCITNSDAGVVIRYLVNNQYCSEAPVDAGAYYVRFSVPKSRNYTGISEERVLIIEKALARVRLPFIAKGLVYNGKEQKLLMPGNIEGGKFVYKIDQGEWSDKFPTAINAGNYHVICKVILDKNHRGDDEENCVEMIVPISKKELMVKITPNGGTYRGNIIPAHGEIMNPMEKEMPEVVINYVGKSNSGMEIDTKEVPLYPGNYVIHVSIQNPNYIINTEGKPKQYVINRADPMLFVDEPEKMYEVGTEFKLNVSYKGNGNISYISSDESVGVVDELGFVKIIGSGKTTIKIFLEESANYVSDEKEVEINAIQYMQEDKKLEDIKLKVYTRSELEAMYEDTVQLITLPVNRMYLRLLQLVEEKNTYTRLRNRIVTEFQRVRLLCEINIDDEEYDILCAYLRKWYHNGIEEGCNDAVDIVFCVALVQIGIRNYDGSYWNHVENVIGKDKKCNITDSQREWLGRVFSETILGFGKAIYKQGENTKNILMHCFVTDNFAPKFFEFLFQYYDYDLERDISGDLEEESLIICNSIKNPYGKRKQFLSNYVYLSIRCDIRYCQMMVAEILSLIDKKFWNEKIEEYRNCRLTEKFIEWSEQEKLFHEEQQYYHAEDGKRAHTRKYRTPYIKCNMEEANFQMVLPPQIIAATNENVFVEWHIAGKDNMSITCNFEESVCGIKTEPIIIRLAAQELFEAFEFKLLVDGNEIRKFAWKNQQIIFFNREGEWIKGENLKVGLYYAFALNDILVECSSILDKRNRRGLFFYELKLEMGDILSIGGKSAYYIGEVHKEGITKEKKLQGVYIENDGKKLEVYYQIPALIIEIEKQKINGTAIIINGIICKLSENNFISVAGKQMNTNYYFIDLKHFNGICNGINYVKVDLPASSRKREYQFVLIPNFNYCFEDAPYAYREWGMIKVNRTIDDGLIKANLIAELQNYKFNIGKLNAEFLNYNIEIGNQILDIYFEVPLLQYSWDKSTWMTEKVAEMWHTELNDFLYLKYPTNKISLCVGRKSDRQYFEYYKNSQGIFECDLTKIKTYLNDEQLLQYIIVSDGINEYDLVRVVMKSYLNSLNLYADYEKNKIVGTLDIIGKSNYYIDVICENICLVEKMSIMSDVFEISASIHSAAYTVKVYENADSDFGFDDDYELVGERTVNLYAPAELENNFVKVDSIQKGTCKLKLQYDYIICIESCQKLHQYQGRMVEKFRNHITYTVPVVIIIPNLNELTQCKIYIKNADEDRKFFQYNKTKSYIINPKYYERKSENIGKYILDEEYIWNVQYLTDVDKNIKEKMYNSDSQKCINRKKINVGSSNYYD